jgi:hypothetical protein
MPLRLSSMLAASNINNLKTPSNAKTHRTWAVSAGGRPHVHPWTNARFSCGIKISFALGRRLQACHVKGRVKLETRTTLSVVPIVTSIAGSESDMRALCG